MTHIQAPVAGTCRAIALRFLVIAGLAAMLGGCYQTRVPPDQYANDYRQRHPITLREGERSVEVFLGRNRGGLTPSQRADVLAFAQTWKHDASGGIVVDVPRSMTRNDPAVDSLREIASIFSASGIPRNGVSVRYYTPSSTALNSIKLGYSRLVASAGPCGLWPADMGPVGGDDHDQNRPYWNLGCATQRNLAAMVDNPADLVQPRGETPVYTARRAQAIDKYRKGENPSGQYSGYDNGKISDLGK